MIGDHRQLPSARRASRIRQGAIQAGELVVHPDATAWKGARIPGTSAWVPDGTDWRSPGRRCWPAAGGRAGARFPARLRDRARRRIGEEPLQPASEVRFSRSEAVGPCRPSHVQRAPGRKVKPAPLSNWRERPQSRSTKSARSSQPCQALGRR
jgi:hypothetical protein